MVNSPTLRLAVLLSAACAITISVESIAADKNEFPKQSASLPVIDATESKREATVVPLSRLITAADRKKLGKGQAISFVEEKAGGHRWVTARVHIRAKRHVVWETVHEERKNDPDLAYSKVLEESKNHAVIEQKFVLLPVIGASVCVMKNHEVPMERIDYQLIKSDRFKAMEGSWTLLPGEDPNSTVLELSTYLDLGLPVPRGIFEGITGKKLERRLTNVKRAAEQAQARTVAQKPE
ncbi:MAG: hypothetical protein K2W82_00310 [Candidatus Obscuribacterales bacterium]|nr:hypothetical protein [Candidatus Obscuribacterales bacterium]